MRAFWPQEVTRGWSPAETACCSHCTERKWRRWWGPAAGAERGESRAATPWAVWHPARRCGKAYWRSSRGRSWLRCWAWPACWRGHRPGGCASLDEQWTRTGGRWPRWFWAPTGLRTLRWWPAAWPWFSRVFAVAPTLSPAPPDSAALSASPSVCGLSESSALRRCCTAGSRW